MLSGRETEAQLAGLADDIWAYSGLGCRNVSLVFLPEGAELRLRMPAVQAKYRNNYLQTRALLRMQGCPFVDLGAAVAVEQWEFPRALSEIAYARYRSADEVAAWLAEHDAELQCVVTETLPITGTCWRGSRRREYDLCRESVIFAIRKPLKINDPK